MDQNPASRQLITNLTQEAVEQQLRFIQMCELEIE